ncbi:MAG: PEP-CTERM sorting domain-containing protein [Leptolyngbya sp. SIOISBB]|nr:PEP-CTERM sorting domain-containing protein [Leptolyngbya sp. SIOISBB]
MKNMMFKAAIAAGLTAASFGLAGTANAGTLSKTISFEDAFTDFTNIDLGDGLFLDIEALIHNGGSAGNAPFTVVGTGTPTFGSSDVPGLGIASSRRDDPELDASGPDEFLRFTFNKNVTLKSVIFEAFDRGGDDDEFDLGVDNVDLEINDTFGSDRIATVGDPAGFPGNTDYIVDFSGGADFAGDGTNALFPVLGKQFDFYTTDRNDNYRIRQLKVHVDVPEPATMLGLGAVAAAGLLAQKRSRKETA